MLIIPAVSFAETTADATSVSANVSTSRCVSLLRDLKHKEKDAFTTAEVKNLQTFLRSEKLLDGEPTGYFGDLTLNAVKAFQAINDVEPTGYVGTMTRELIKKKSCTGQPKVQNKPQRPIVYDIMKFQDKTQTGLVIQEVAYQRVYRPGDQLNLKIKVLQREGKKVASDAEGFNVQVIPYDSNNKYVSTNYGSAGGNALYSAEDGLWHFYPNESLAAGVYSVEIVAYCANEQKACGTMLENPYEFQTSKKIKFKVLNPTEGTVLIKNSSKVKDHTSKAGTVKEKFGAYEVSVPKALKGDLVVAEQTFHLMLPVVGFDLLKDVYIVNEKRKIVAGPVDAVGEGYDNQLQKITFTDEVTYKPGKHTYTIIGTIPSSFKKGFSFSLSTTPDKDWVASEDLSQNGTITLNKVQSVY